MPVHSSVLGTTNTDDAEAAAVRWERKKNTAHSLLFGERKTEEAFDEEGSSKENIKAVFVRRIMTTAHILKMDEMSSRSSSTFHQAEMVVSKQIGLRT